MSEPGFESVPDSVITDKHEAEVMAIAEDPYQEVAAQARLIGQPVIEQELLTKALIVRSEESQRYETIAAERSKQAVKLAEFLADKGKEYVFAVEDSQEAREVLDVVYGLLGVGPPNEPDRDAFNYENEEWKGMSWQGDYNHIGGVYPQAYILENIGHSPIGLKVRTIRNIKAINYSEHPYEFEGGGNYYSYEGTSYRKVIRDTDKAIVIVVSREEVVPKTRSRKRK